MDENSKNPFGNLPNCAADYVRDVIKKMRWCKKVRADVQAELISHFEDALKDCKTNEEKEKTAKKIISEFGDAKILAVLARRAKKRCRPLWQKIFIKAFQISGIIIGLFILYVIWFFSGRPKITTNYIAELNRIVKPAGADDSQNAAFYYNEAAEKIEKFPGDVNEVIKKSYYECNEVERKSISDWLAKNQDTLKLISAGNEKPYCWNQYEAQNNEVMSVPLPKLSQYRSLGRILCWNAQLLAQQGNYSKAFENIMAAYNMGKHTRSESFIVGQLVAIAIESVSTQNLRKIISGYNVGSSELQKLQNEFQTITRGEVFTISFKTEKLFMYDELQRCFTDDFIGSGHIYPQRFFEIMYEPQEKKNSMKELGIIFEAIYSNSSRNDTYQKIDRLFSYYEKISDISPALQRQQNINIDEEFKKIAGNNLFIKMLAPALGKVTALSYRNKADVQATLTIIAIIRYKQDTGDYPDSLQQLFEKGYLKEMPLDPYSDKSLIYKKTENNFALYSVGSDFKDNGGKAYEAEPGKYKIWSDANDGDAVFWPVMNLKK